MAKPSTPPHIVNQQELAEMFGVPRRTLQVWDRGDDGLREAACISEKPLKYDALAAWRWRWDRKRKETTSLSDAKIRKLEAEAATKELELAEARGEVIRIEVFDRVMGGILDRLRAKIIAFEGSLAPRITGLDTPREAKAVLRPVFEELVEVLRRPKDDEDADAA